MQLPQTNTVPNSRELSFQEWYKGWSSKLGLHPDPDHAEHKYDYRAAFEANVIPQMDPGDGQYHWDSQYKHDDHPNRYIEQNGQSVDTKNGSKVQQTIDDGKGAVEETFKKADQLKIKQKNYNDINDSLETLVSSMPHTVNTITKLQKNGDYSLSTAATIAAQENRKKKKKPVSTLGFMDKVAEIGTWQGLGKILPFISGIVDVGEMRTLLVAADALGDGTASEEQLKILQEYVDHAEADKNLGYMILDILHGLPSFILELGFTGSIYTGVRKAATETAKATLKKLLTKEGKEKLAKFTTEKTSGKIAREAIGVTAGASVQAVPVGATRIPAEALQRMMPGVTLNEEEELIIAGPGDSASEALIKATKGMWIEMVSERTGGAFKLAGKPVKEAVARTSLMKWWHKKFPGSSNDLFKKHVEKVGWHGMVNEYFEERVAELGRATPGIGTGDPLPDYTSEDFLKQSVAELAAFSVIPGGSYAAGRVLDKVKEEEGEKVDEAVQEAEAVASLSPKGVAGVDKEGRKVSLGKPAQLKVTRKHQEKAMDEVDAAIEAGETTEGVGVLAKHLLENNPDFDSQASLEISNEVNWVTDEFIREEYGMEPEEWYKLEGVAYEEQEGEGRIQGLGATLPPNIQKGIAKTAVQLYKGHDADTLIEEWYHEFWLNNMDAKDRQAWDAYHDKSGDTRSSEEHFGQEGRDFFFSEKMHEEAAGIRKIFENAKEAMFALFNRIRKLRGAKVPKKIQDIYKRAGIRKLGEKTGPVKPLNKKQKKMMQVRKADLRLKAKPKSKEFKSWFGDSKVVDDKGQPAVAYHGTIQDIEAFDENPLNFFTLDPQTANFYARDHRGRSKEPGTEEGGQVYPVYLNIKNPLDLTHEDIVLDLGSKRYFHEFITFIEAAMIEKGVKNWQLTQAENEDIAADAALNIQEDLKPNYDGTMKELEAQALDEVYEENSLYHYFDNNQALKKILQDKGFDGIIASEDIWQSGSDGRIFITFNPNQIKGQFNLKPTKGPKIMHQVRGKTKPTFFSQAEKVVQDKFPESMKISSVKNWLLKNQVKPEELKWLDIDKILETPAIKKHGKVTKAQLLLAINIHNIKVEDVKYTDMPDKVKFRVGDLEVYRDNELVDYTRFDPMDPVENLKMSLIENFELKKWELSGRLRMTVQSRILMHLDGTLNEEKLNKEHWGTRHYFDSQQVERKAQERISDADKRIDYLEQLIHSVKTDDFEFELEEGTSTSYSEHQLEGDHQVGDYTELLLTLPGFGKETGTHWKQSNVMAHVRFNTRLVDDKKVLFIEEIQSDWHQEGAREGYRTDPVTFNKVDLVDGTQWENENGEVVIKLLTHDKWEDGTPIYKTRNRDYKNLEAAKEAVRIDMRGKVIDAPFKGTGWIELVMKRMLRYAAENDMDAIAWTTAAQQIDRWQSNLRQNLDTIQWQKPKVKGYKNATDLLADREIPRDTPRDKIDVWLDIRFSPDDYYRQEWYERFERGDAWGRMDMESRKQWESLYPDPAMKRIWAEGKSVIINGIKDKKSVFHQSVPLEGETMINGTKVTLDRLIGKRMANKIRDDKKRTGSIEGGNLAIGGQLHKLVYDKAIPSALNKMAKRNNWGVRVKEIELSGDQGIFPKIDAAALFNATQLAQGWSPVDEQEKPSEKDIKEVYDVATELEKNPAYQIPAWIYNPNISMSYYIQKARESQKKAVGPRVSTQPAMQISGQMKKGVMEKGQPLFQVRKKEDLSLQNIPIEKLADMNAVAEYLDKRAAAIAKDLGVDLTQNTDEVRDILSDIISQEIKEEYKNEKNAIGWYGKKMAEAIDHLAKIYPELKSDPIHNQVFKITLAIRSNGAAVEDNLDFAITSYESWRENGILPEKLKRGGKERRAMEKGHKFYNDLVNDHGVEWVHDFINTKYTARDLKKAGLPQGGELADQVVMGSVVFGPKVGGGFMANVNGHFEYLTMDRWFMRLMGRLRGNLDEGKDYSVQLKRFVSMLRRSKAMMKKYGVTAKDLKDEAKMLSVAKKVQSEYAKSKLDPKTKKPKTFIPKTKLNMASNTLMNRFELHIQPTAQERIFFRAVMKEAVRKSKIRGLTVADAQAIIWFPEKRLYAKFEVGTIRGQKETNYEIEARELVKRRSDDSGRPGQLLQEVPTKKDARRGKKAKEPKQAKKPQEKVAYQVRPKRLVSKPKTKATRPLELDPESRPRLWQRNMQDSLNRLGHVMKKVEEVRPLSDEEDAYRAAELYPTASLDKINILNWNIIKGKKSLLARVVKAGYTIEEFGKYLYARHAEERNDHIAKIRDDMPDGGSGMFKDEWVEIIAEHKGDKLIEAFAEEFYEKVTRRALRERLAAGLIEQKTFDHLTGYYDNYVPLFAILDVENRSSSTGQGLSMPGGLEIKRAKGSTRKRYNPVFSALIELENIIVRAGKNVAGQKFLDIAEEFESEAWTVRRQRFKPVFDEYGEIQYMEPRFKIQDNEFAVRRNGKLYLIEINDIPLLEGLKNVGLNWNWPKAMTNLNSYFKNMLITLNLDFVWKNFFRDVPTALFNVAVKYPLKTTAKVLAKVPSAVPGVWRSARHKEKTTKWSKKYDELKSKGGRVGWFDMDNYEEHMLKLESQLKDTERSALNIKKLGKALFNLMSDINEAIESGVRLATYDTLVNEGISKDRAAQEAKNVTVNFNKKGKWGSQFNGAYWFWNATVQGGFRLASNFKKETRTRTMLLLSSPMAASMGIAIQNALTAPDEWEKKAWWERDHYFIIMKPDGNDIRYPLPYGLNIFHTIATITGELVAESIIKGTDPKDIDYGVILGRILTAANNAFSPFGDGTPLQVVAPSLLDFPAQIYEGKKFTEAPLYPAKNPFGPRNVPDWANYYHKNPPSWVSRMVTQYLAQLNFPWKKGGEIHKGKGSGKDEFGRPKDQYTDGWIDVNPITLDHAFEFIGGGLGKFIKRSIKTGMNFLKGEPTPKKDVPFIRQFLGEPDKTAAAEKRLIYEMIEYSKITTYNHVETARFKRYVWDAIRAGQLSKKQAESVDDGYGRMVPRIIRDFLQNQRRSKGINPIDFKKRKKKKKSRSTRRSQ